MTWFIGIIIGWLAIVFASCLRPNYGPGYMKALRAPMFGRGLIGCDYRDPEAHLARYPSGCVHLCNSACIHEPPEER